jgi:hypothetical protein
MPSAGTAIQITVYPVVKSGTWNIDNLLNPHPVKIQTSSGTAFLVIDSTGKIGINNFPASFQIKSSAGTALLIVNSDGSINVVAKQTTRTSLLMKGEREDLISLGGTVSASAGSGVQIIAGVSGKVIKVYDAGFDALTAGLHHFYFGTGTSPTSKRFCTRQSGTGPIHQSFEMPRCGSAGSGLYLYCGVAETNIPYDLGYVQE